jgi:hypothetical protein
MLTETMLIEGVEAMADRAMIVNMAKAPSVQYPVHDNIGMIRLRQAFQERLLLHNKTNLLIFLVSADKMKARRTQDAGRRTQAAGRRLGAWSVPLPEWQAVVVDLAVRTGSASHSAHWIRVVFCGLDPW